MKGLSLVSVVVVIVGVLIFRDSAAPAPARAATSNALAEVIAGAKKEGTVTMLSLTGFTPASYERLRREIRNKFDVDLKFSFMDGWFATDYSKALLESKAGLTPTWDLSHTWGTFLTGHISNGLIEKVDWEPLLLPGTPPGVVIGTPPQLDFLHGYGITAQTSFTGGIIYNPEKVSAAEVPKSFSDLADPKWSGKVGVNRAPSVWSNVAWCIGEEKLLSDLRAIIANGAIVGRSPDLFTRYTAGEIIMGNMASSFLVRLQRVGKPAKWQTLNVGINRVFPFVIRKGAPHPNAAKLVAVYLAGPDGRKLIWDETKAGNCYYPGNFEHDILNETLAQGIRVVNQEESELLQFLGSEKNAKLEKKIAEIIAGR